MLSSLKDLHHYTIAATDGDIGKVVDFYFEDDTWVIRYLVIETGEWLLSRKVLISPFSIIQANGHERTLSVGITKEQVRNSPDIDTDQPVSRQHEMQFLTYYGYPYYWGGDGMWGGGFFPSAMLPNYVEKATDQITRNREGPVLQSHGSDPHLRSCREVVSYHIHAQDGEIGHVDALLVDDETWLIKYMVVNTSNWWVGHQALIASDWVNDVSWLERSMTVGLSRALIKNAPPFSSTKAMNREDELRLYHHYSRRGN